MEKKQNLQGTATIAKLFGVTERQIQKLAKSGILPVVSKNPYKFDLLPTIQTYVRYLTARVEARQKSEEVEVAEFDKLRAEAGIKRSKSKITELELREMENNMHEAEDVEDMYADLLLVIAEKIEELPDQTAAKLSEASTALQASSIIRTECCRILNELSEYEYDPGQAAKRRKARKTKEASFA